jgi:hypothetical protein
VAGQGEAPDKNKAQYGSMWQLENFLDERDGRDFFVASDAISIFLMTPYPDSHG